MLADSNIIWSFAKAFGHMATRNKAREETKQQFQYNYILRTVWKQSTKYTKESIALTKELFRHQRKQEDSLRKTLASWPKGNYQTYLSDFFAEYEAEKKLKMKKRKFGLDKKMLVLAQSLTPGQVVALFGISQFPGNPIGGAIATVNPLLGGGIALSLQVLKVLIIGGFVVYASRYGTQMS